MGWHLIPLYIDFATPGRVSSIGQSPIPVDWKTLWQKFKLTKGLTVSLIQFILKNAFDWKSSEMIMKNSQCWGFERQIHGCTWLRVFMLTPPVSPSYCPPSQTREIKWLYKAKHLTGHATGCSIEVFFISFPVKRAGGYQTEPRIRLQLDNLTGPGIWIRFCFFNKKCGNSGPIFPKSCIRIMLFCQWSGSKNPDQNPSKNL